MTTDPIDPHPKGVEVSKRLVTINATSSVVAKIVNTTVVLWLYQYLLRRIPAEEFAVLPVVTAIMVFAPLFFSFFADGIGRYVVDAYAKGETDRVTAIVSSVVPPLVGLALLFLGAGGLFSLNIEKVLNIAPHMVQDARIMMFLLVASFALQMLALPFTAGFQVRQAFVELSLLGIGRDFLRILLLLVFLLGIGPQVIWVVVATAVSEIVYTSVVVARSRAKVPELVFRAQLCSRDQAWELMHFGLWTTLGRLGDVMNTNAATIILNIYGSAVDVTSYHIGSTFYRQIINTIGTAIQPLQPVMTAMHALGDKPRLGRTVFRAGRYSLWAAMAVATPLAIYANEAVNLYVGDTYASAATVIILFMMIFPFSQPTSALVMTAISMARVRAFFLPAFLFQLGGLALMVWFATSTTLGAIGVTLSWTIVVIVSQLVYYWGLCLKLTGLGARLFFARILAPGLLPALVAAVVWGALKLVAPPTSWVELLLCAVGGGIVYTAVLLFFCIDAGERRDLRLLLSSFGLES